MTYLANDNVVNNGFDFTPSVMIACLWKLQMGNAQGFDFKIFPLEFGSHGKFLPSFPIPMDIFTMLGQHWGMVGDLFTYQLESHIFTTIKFKGFTQ